MVLSKELTENEDILRSLLELIPDIFKYHSPNSDFYKFIEKISKYSSFKLFGPNQNEAVELGSIGRIKLPYYSMGAINSTHLFGLDELILFAFYTKNKNRYKKVADLGANIGLHSIVLSKLGFDVTSYEPDLIHVEKFNENINNNCLENKPNLINKAISTKEGQVEFIRIKNNTTGSHISGSKDSLYGDLDKFTVQTDSFKDLISKFDFLKIDIEGHEAEVLLSTSLDDWTNTDAMIEVGSLKNAEKIFNFFNKIGVKLYSQKQGWERVENLGDMPTSYKEGSLFITCKENVPW
ncbi:FkbM family methyltransferase [Prochlorococcus sp. AH-716-K03]|nr:FkbM family methyltransferase [Prochlorococcus sp. AH-716-K03]